MRSIFKVAIFVFAMLQLSINAMSQDTTSVASKRFPDTISEPVLVDEVIAVVGNKMVLLSDLHTQQAIWKQQRGLNPSSKLSGKDKVDIFENMLIQ